MEDDDNVIEPGEKGFINSIVVVNEGKMPTPKYSDFVIQCRENDYIKPLTSCSIACSILPGT